MRKHCTPWIVVALRAGPMASLVCTPEGTGDTELVCRRSQATKPSNARAKPPQGCAREPRTRPVFGQMIIKSPHRARGSDHRIGRSPVNCDQADVTQSRQFAHFFCANPSVAVHPG